MVTHDNQEGYVLLAWWDQHERWSLKCEKLVNRFLVWGHAAPFQRSILALEGMCSVSPFRIVLIGHRDFNPPHFHPTTRKMEATYSVEMSVSTCGVPLEKRLQFQALWIIIWTELNLKLPIPVAARSKAWVGSPSHAGIAGSNPTGGMDVCLLWVLCVVR
jgi:hypothetical protein